MVMSTNTYDPSEFPAFAVTVDVVVLTMAKGRLQVLLVHDVVSGEVVLAFDHAAILGDAVDRVRTDLELTGTATAFLAPAFTLAELRSVYEAVWNVRFDAANFRKRVLAEDGWVIATGRRARPGAAGGKPAELYRAGRRWKHGSPLRRR